VPAVQWWLALGTFRKCLYFGTCLTIVDAKTKYPGPPKTWDLRMAEKAIKAAKIDYRTRQEEECIAWEKEQRDKAPQRAEENRKKRALAEKTLREYVPGHVRAGLPSYGMFKPKDPTDSDGLYVLIDPETKEHLMNDGTKMTPEVKAAYEAETDEDKKMEMLRVRTPGYHDDTEDEEAAQEAIANAMEAEKAAAKDADAAPPIDASE